MLGSCVVEEGSKPIPHVDDTPQGNHIPDDRDQRIEALRHLAQEGGQALSPSTPSTSTTIPTSAAPRSRKVLLLAGISALVVVAVAAGLIARAVLSSAPTRQQQTNVTRVFDPKSDGVSCPKDASWSPDGGQLLLYYPLLNGAQIWGSRDLPQ